MKAIDMHSHMSTKRGFIFTKPEELDQLQRIYRMQVTYKDEAEMAQDFITAGVKAILAGPYGRTMEECRERNDYVAQVVKDYPQAFLGAWADVNPPTGAKGLKELERCLKDLKMIGAAFLASFTGVPYNDKRCFPLYQLCVEAKVPVMFYVGHTGAGAGLPGGAGIRLELSRPVPYVDDVAAKFPELKIDAAHPAWPWQDEMISVLLHKPNVFNDLHGWSPKYFSPELKSEIRGRLQDRFMFGADYPLFSHERLFKDWEKEGYEPEILNKVFLKNASNFLGIPLPD